MLILAWRHLWMFPYQIVIFTLHFLTKFNDRCFKIGSWYTKHLVLNILKYSSWFWKSHQHSFSSLSVIMKTEYIFWITFLHEDLLSFQIKFKSYLTKLELNIAPTKHCTNCTQPFKFRENPWLKLKQILENWGSILSSVHETNYVSLYPKLNIYFFHLVTNIWFEHEYHTEIIRI